MRELSKLFKALADRNRLRILYMLRKKPLCVCEIREVLQLAVSTVSKHLAILRDAGFILDFKQGKWVNYRRNDDRKATQIHTLLKWVDQWLENDPVANADELLVAKADRNKICGV